MNYTVSLNGWGRFFNVPSSIVDKYIKLASEYQLKVLLYILCNGQSFTTNEISQNTGIKEADVDDSIIFWCQNGVLKVEELQNFSSPVKTAEYSGNEKNVISESTVLSAEVVSPATGIVPKSPKLTPKQLDEIISKNDSLQKLQIQAQEILGREITYYDSCTLVKMFSDYGFPAASIILLLEFCKAKGKVDSGIAYTKRIAKDWLEKDIIDPSDVEAEIIRLSEAMKIENRITREMQLQGRLSNKQKAIIKEWVNNKYNIDLIMLAYDKCVENIQKVEFNYINAILCAWKDKKITTVKDAENEQVPEFKKASNKRNSSDSTKQHSYDLNEIEKHALHNTPKLNINKR